MKSKLQVKFHIEIIHMANYASESHYCVRRRYSRAYGHMHTLLSQNIYKIADTVDMVF